MVSPIRSPPPEPAGEAQSPPPPPSPHPAVDPSPLSPDNLFPTPPAPAPAPAPAPTPTTPPPPNRSGDSSPPLPSQTPAPPPPTTDPSPPLPRENQTTAQWPLLPPTPAPTSPSPPAPVSSEAKSEPDADEAAGESENMTLAHALTQTEEAIRSPPGMPAFHAYGDGGCLVSVPAELAGLFCRAGGAVQQRKRSLVAASAVAAAAAECVRASKKQRQRPQPSLDALLGSIRPCELGQAAAAAAPSLPDLNEEFIMEDKDESPVDPCVERVLEGKDATDVRLAAMAVVAGSHGGLEKLAVRGSHPTRGVTDQGLLAVARGSPNLCSLALWDVPLVTDAGLAEIAAGCPSLERLDITRCPLITDKGLAAVAQGCPNLVSLTIEACPGVGNEGLRAIGRCCSKLQAVNIKNCAHVGCQGISSLVCSAAASLAWR